MGIGGWTDEYELQNLASYPYASNYFKVDKFDALAGFKQKILDLICDSMYY